MTSPPNHKPKEWDGRSVGESAPHAAYCDLALQDAQVQESDKGELIWSYDDALFDKSLAGNGYEIVPVGREALRKAMALIEAAQEWAGDSEGMPSNPSDARLMKALWTYEGDRKEPCPECDGDCGEPCAPCTVAAAHASLDEFIADWLKRHGIRALGPEGETHE